MELTEFRARVEGRVFAEYFRTLAKRRLDAITKGEARVEEYERRLRDAPNATDEHRQVVEAERRAHDDWARTELARVGELHALMQWTPEDAVYHLTVPQLLEIGLLSRPPSAGEGR